MKQPSLLFLLFLVHTAFAQNTVGILAPIAKSGLHQIVIPAEIRSFSKSDFSDFRIYDEKGNEVPYAFLPQQEKVSQYKFRPFTILSQKAIPKQNTEIIIEISLKEINEITLFLATAEVAKKFSISGSDDQKQWFGLVNNREWADIRNERSSLAYKSIPLPINQYKFLKISFDDKKTLPLNVIQAGYFGHTKAKQQLWEIIKPEKTATARNKTPKQTLIEFHFNEKPFISQVKFEISSPNFYNRHARLYKKVIYKIRKKEKIRQEILAEFDLNSDKINIFRFDPIQETNFFIEISDRDNPPLKFSKIEFSQQLFTVIADLEVQKQYTLKTGNLKLQSPDYDLQNDPNRNNDSLPKATITAIKHRKSGIFKTGNDSLWQKPWFMWLCIILGGIIIGYFSFALLKDLNK